MNIIDNAYLELRNAIVGQAVYDYQSALKTRAKLQDKPFPTKSEKDRLARAKRMIYEVRTFFKSEWCKFLCGDVDTQYILERIERECK